MQRGGARRRGAQRVRRRAPRDDAGRGDAEQAGHHDHGGGRTADRGGGDGAQRTDQADGDRRVRAVMERLGVARIAFAGRDPFFNVNTPRDMALAERRARGTA